MTTSPLPPGPAEVPGPRPLELPTVPDLPQRWPEQVPALPPEWEPSPEERRPGRGRRR